MTIHFQGRKHLHSIYDTFRSKGKTNKNTTPNNLEHNLLYQESLNTIYQNGAEYLVGVNENKDMSLQLNFAS